jgi:hypothetical protein
LTRQIVRSALVYIGEIAGLELAELIDSAIFAGLRDVLTLTGAIALPVAGRAVAVRPATGASGSIGAETSLATAVALAGRVPNGVVGSANAAVQRAGGGSAASHKTIGCDGANAFALQKRASGPVGVTGQADRREGTGRGHGLHELSNGLFQLLLRRFTRAAGRRQCAKDCE